MYHQPTLGLGDQIGRDFPAAADVRGMRNYECLDDGGTCEDAPCLDGGFCSLREMGCLYFDAIRKADILLDKEERKASIVEQVKQAASLVGGEAIIEEGLLNEVTNLVEMPTAVMGGFEKEYLSLPRDVLISVMKKHQRYFPVQKNGKLLAHFIAIRNGDDIGIDVVRQGNEHVLAARFADANFFVREDLKLKLEEYRPKLSTLIVQAKLGSMLDKSGRIEKIVNELIPMLGLENDEAIFARRAAHLANPDLVTQTLT